MTHYLRTTLLSLILIVWALPSSALTIEISSGGDNPVVIANSPFAWQANSPIGDDIASIVDADLKRSGYFAPLARSRMPKQPTRADQVEFADWRQAATEYLLIGNVQGSADNLAVKYELYNIIAQQRVLAGTISGSSTQVRTIAHKISDMIFEKITGTPGIFSTSILYVSSRRTSAGKFNYHLVRADADAQNPRIILESSEPIVSPSWSPDKSQVAYTSFENGRSEIFVQSLATGRRMRLVSTPGLNSSPAWSPDGSEIAFSSSKDGNPEIYVIDVATRSVRRITQNNFAIDTEPSWFPDGRTLAFTSDRAGQPQIYSVSASGGEAQRLTFGSNTQCACKNFPRRQKNGYD